jgi:hypothetical protein
MRQAKAVFLSALLLASAGCSYAGNRDAVGESAPAPHVSGGGGTNARQEPSTASDIATAKQKPAAGVTAGQSAPAGRTAEPVIQNVSLSQADAAQQAPAAAERKIIRDAALTVEAESPAEAQRRIASLAEARGGFVVTSESKQQGGYGDTKPYEVVTLEVRVPSTQFDAVLGEIRAAGSRVASERITGQDVTEEYIDLEARIRTQKALESQFLEIMKRAARVSDALEVQNALADVRTEIERLEGRRRFLENQTSLSTIRVTLQPPAPLVSASASGFFQGVGRAVGNGVDIAADITLVLIQAALALIPVLLLVVLPFVLLLRYALRRVRRRRAALAAVEAETQAARGATT